MLFTSQLNVVIIEVIAILVEYGRDMSNISKQQTFSNVDKFWKNVTVLYYFILNFSLHEKRGKNFQIKKIKLNEFA